MSAGAGTEFTVEDLVTIMAEVWTAYLDPDGGHPLTAGEDAGALPVTASIAISGSWSGHILLGYSLEAAGTATAAMLRLPPHKVTGDDVIDAVGELANIVAGNIKSLLAPPTTLGLPTVHVGTDCQIRFPGTTRTHHTPLRWHGDPIVASVWAVQPDAARRAG